MSQKMKRLLGWCGLMALTGTPVLAESVALDFALTPPDAQNNNRIPVTVGASVDTFLGVLTDSDSATTTVSGNALADLDLAFDSAGGVTGISTIAFTGGRIQFDDDLSFALSFALGLATVDITTADLAAQLNTPAPPAPVTGSSFDLAHHEINVNEGQLIAVGGGAASSANENIDFSAEPIIAPLSGTATLTVQLDEIVNGVGSYSATIDAPIAFSQTIEVDETTSASVAAAGTLLAQASFMRVVFQPGDTDSDGDIDDSDLGTSFANYTGPIGAAGGKTFAQGDTDGDGDVDDSDLGTAFAGYTGPNAPASVPEPASLMLLASGLLVPRRR